VPECDVCKGEMTIGKNIERSRDKQAYKCDQCLTRETIRYKSLLFSMTASLQQIVRCIFYYFPNNYQPDLA